MGEVERRRFLAALGAAALANPLFGFAQRTSKVPQVGILLLDAADTDLVRKRRRWMHELLGQSGWIVGKDVILEWRFAEGKSDRLPNLAGELVRLKVDVIVATLDKATHVAARATKTIPIVMYAYNGDPVRLGLAASLARPGGNVTGVLRPVDVVEQVLKQYELLKQAVPTAVNIASLWAPWTSDESDSFQLVDQMHKRIKEELGLLVTSFVVRSSEEVPWALDRISAFKPDAFFVADVPLIRARYNVVTAFAKQQKLVSMSSGPNWVHEGGLLYYGPDVRHNFGRMVTYVDRILRGARPGDLPIEQPVKFEFLFNAKTAREVGYTLPPELQLRVTQVIE